MATHRKELSTTVREQGFNFTPTTLEEAQKYAMIFANSGICPEAYRGRPNDVLIIWQMGNELGLGKMQSLRTLGCINGMPFAWGDGLLALVKRHKDFADMSEWTEGSLTDGNLTAFCTIKRRGQEPTTQKFSIEDAKRAGLWLKKGTWTQYPARMLQHRARGFAARDAFPDALYGLMSEEEVKSIHIKDETVKPLVVKGKGISGLENTLGINDDEIIIEGEVMPIDIDKELLDLIIEKNVPEKSLAKWCEQFDAAVLVDIPEEGKQKIINYLKEKQ